MADRRLKRDISAARVPHHAGFVDAEMAHHRGDVVGEYLERPRSAAVLAETVAPGMQRDDLVRPGHFRQRRTEHLRRRDAPVQHDQGWAVTVDLVVELDAVDFGVTFRFRCVHGLFSRRRRLRGYYKRHGNEYQQWSGRSYVLASVTRSSSTSVNCSAAAPVLELPDSMESSRA